MPEFDAMRESVVTAFGRGAMPSLGQHARCQQAYPPKRGMAPRQRPKNPGLETRCAAEPRLPAAANPAAEAAAERADSTA